MNEPNERTDSPTVNGDAPLQSGAAGKILLAGGALIAILAGAYFFSAPKPGGAAATVDWNDPPPRSTVETNEAAALSLIRQIALCVDRYSGANPRWGYPAAVEQLSATGTNCLDAATAKAIADGEELSGYRISYQPAGSDSDGRNTQFEIQARPARFGRSGIRSFTLDRPDIYLTRFTANDRAATEADSLVY